MKKILSLAVASIMILSALALASTKQRLNLKCPVMMSRDRVFIS